MACFVRGATPRMASRLSGPIHREGDWTCECGTHNYGKRRKCMTCSNLKANGTLLTKKNMHSRKRYRRKKKKTNPVAATDIYAHLQQWSIVHPFGTTISIPLQVHTWVQTLLDCVVPSEGAHIHTQTSQWKFFKINLGTRKIDDPAWLNTTPMIFDRLNKVAYESISVALQEVAQYKGCIRDIKEHGAIWNLPCGAACEICSLIFQPNGAERQAMHTDGHKRYTMPDTPDKFLYTYFLNVIVPLIGDVPTVFRGSNRELRTGTRCGPNMIRIFNGGLWHAGDANDTGKGVWKLFLGLVPGNHPTAGDFPLFEENAGKSLAAEKQRLILVADDR